MKIFDEWLVQRVTNKLDTANNLNPYRTMIMNYRGACAMVEYKDDRNCKYYDMAKDYEQKLRDYLDE